MKNEQREYKKLKSTFFLLWIFDLYVKIQCFFLSLILLYIWFYDGFYSLVTTFFIIIYYLFFLQVVDKRGLGRRLGRHMCAFDTESHSL